MFLGTCVTNSNGDLGYTVSVPFRDGESKEWFVKVIWVDNLLAVIDGKYPNTLPVTDERKGDLYI